jgi:hypothetical protein
VTEVVDDRLLARAVTTSTSSTPAARASATTSWIAGVAPTGSSSLATVRVTGRIRVPRPAAGRTAFTPVDLRSVARCLASTVPS